MKNYLRSSSYYMELKQHLECEGYSYEEIISDIKYERKKERIQWINMFINNITPFGGKHENNRKSMESHAHSLLDSGK